MIRHNNKLKYYIFKYNKHFGILVVFTLLSWFLIDSDKKNEEACSPSNYFETHREEFANKAFTSSNMLEYRESSMIAIILEATTRKNGVFVDIGTNKGEFSELIAYYAPHGHYIMFDILEISMKRLDEKFNGKIAYKPELLAMTDVNDGETVKFYGRSDWAHERSFPQGTSLLVRDSKHKAVLGSVNKTTLDEYFEGFDALDFVKIDTEGNDAGVLKGAYNLLRNKKIKALYFENNKMQRSKGYNLRSTVEYLNSLGYNSYLFGSERLVGPLHTICEDSYVFESKTTLNILVFERDSILEHKFISSW